ncbi:MAG TPA: LLM class flavin-dependent oxidoreductase [Acidimicrobiales bacterium]|nr:LLM class flavin-dependent oxidoreductase [Acidimicrobiales bacterium]
MSAPLPATGVWLFPEAPAPELVAAAEHAEALGFDEWWLGDEGPAREPFAVLAAAAVRTRRILLAVGIANPYTRHPGLTAATALTVHELSGGRAILGVGAGGGLTLDPFELDAPRPLAAVERMIRLARAVADDDSTEGYRPPEHRITSDDVGVALPVYVGARGERLNRLASRVADGAFVAGLPPVRLDEVIGWVRSVRPVRVALYPSVAFDEHEIERSRPQMIWALVNTPDATRAALGLDGAELCAAADALRAGDERPARRIMTDELLAEVLLTGAPDVVGRRLADLVRRHRPDSIGLALLQRDLTTAIDRCAEAMDAMRTALTDGARAGTTP